MLPRWSIRSLLALLIVALLAPLLGLTVFFGFRAYAADRERAEEGLLNLAEAASAGVAQFLFDSRRIMQGLAATEAVRALAPERCDEFGAIGPTLSPAFTNVGSWRLDGTPVCSLLETPAGLDMSGTPGFDEALAADSFAVLPVSRGRRSGRWVVGLITPIRSEPGGAKIGLLSLSVDLLELQHILSGLRIPPDGIVSVTQLDGTVVARSVDAERWVGTAPPALDAASPDDPTFSIRGFSTARTFEGVPFAWGFVRVPETTWVVYAGRPSAAVFGSVRSLSLRLALLGGVVALVALGLGLAVYRRVAGSLQRLVEGVAAAPAGGAPLPTDGPLEIAWVAQRFNAAMEERAGAERARKRADERVRSVFDNAVMGIAISSEDGYFVDVNQAFVDLLGYPSRRALLDTPVADLYDDPEEHARIRREVGVLMTFRGVPVLWKRADGSTIHVRISGRRFTLEDGRVGWEVFAEDVTEIARLRERSVQLEKMEALGRLSGGVAHDFNNLLTVVQGEADLLRLDPGVTDEQREQLDQILAASKRGAALTRQLLAFGRRSPSDKWPLDPNRLVTDFELVLRRAMGEEVELRISLEPDVGRVLADRSRIEQVLMNLLVNARDAMPRGGSVSLSTSVVQVSREEADVHPAASAGPHVVITVEDDGEGIPDDVLPHIFEPFYSTKPSSQGTGLGLATVYGVVADCGGHVRVRSVVGRGTVFRIFLPRIEATERREAPADRPARLAFGAARILLVEDEAGVRNLTRRILEGAGYIVTAAADGREGLMLAAARKEPVDLLVTDVVMPGMRGPELAEALAASGKVRRAVLISGYPEGLAESGPAGILAWRFLPKPFRAQQLLQVVSEVLAQDI